MDISPQFLDDVVGTSFWFVEHQRRCKILKETPQWGGGVNYTGCTWESFGEYRSFISETVRNRPIVTMDH